MIERKNWKMKRLRKKSQRKRKRKWKYSRKIIRKNINNKIYGKIIKNNIMNNNKTNKRFKILHKPLKIMIKIKNEKYMNKEKKEGVVDKMKIDNMIMV
jgi:hypothetical protein